MDHFQPRCVTSVAKEIALKHQSKRVDEGGTSFGGITERKPLAQSFDPSRGPREVKIDAKGMRTILFGSTSIDISYLEQVIDPSQTRAIGLMIHYYSENYLEKTLSLREGLAKVIEEVQEKGFDILLPYKIGNLAVPRIYELAGAINRMRSLKIR
jgi:predicted ABC-class ATPase